jgi:hypothetical protein
LVGDRHAKRDPLGRGARLAALTCGAGQPHLAAAGPPLNSHAFWCLLCTSSATFRSVRVMGLVLSGFLPSQLLDKSLEKDYFANLCNLVSLVPGFVMMMVLGSSRVFRVVFIDDFLSSAPNMENDMSVSIISTSSPPWCAQILHLRYFYMAKYQISCKTSENNTTRGTH